MDRGDYFVMAIGAFHCIHIWDGCFRYFVFLFLFFLCQFGIEKFSAIAAFFCLREDFFGAVGAFFVFRHDWLLFYDGLGWFAALWNDRPTWCCRQAGEEDFSLCRLG